MMKRGFFLWLCLILLQVSAAQSQSIFEVTNAVPMVFSDKIGTKVLAETDHALSPEQARERINDFRAPESIGRIQPRQYYWVLSHLQSRLDTDKEIRIEMPMWEGMHPWVIFDDGKTQQLQSSGNFWGNYSKLSDANPYVELSSALNRIFRRLDTGGSGALSRDDWGRLFDAAAGEDECGRHAKCLVVAVVRRRVL